jgi:hypothetical protein
MSHILAQEINVGLQIFILRISLGRCRRLAFGLLRVCFRLTRKWDEHKLHKQRSQQYSIQGFHIFFSLSN